MTAATTTVMVPKSVRLAYSVLRAQAERDPSGDHQAVRVAASILLTSARGGSR